jgi:hypothetical protein
MQRRDRAAVRGGAGGGLLPGGRGGVGGTPRRGGRIKWFVLGLALIGCARMAGLIGGGVGGGGAGSGTRAARMLGDALGGAAGWAGAVAPAGAKVAGGGLGAARDGYRNPPPSKAPRAVASPPPKPPPAPGAPPPGRDPDCRTCGIATMLDFNTHAVDLFKQIDGNTNRGLFVRAPWPRRARGRATRLGQAVRLVVSPSHALPLTARAAPCLRSVRAQVTFGSLGMHEFITNWVLQVQKKRLGPFVVGALDGGAIDLCLEKGYPAAGFGALTMNTTGAYWRQDEGIFLKMATLKTELLRCASRARLLRQQRSLVSLAAC